MKKPRPMNRRHAGPTTRVSDEEFVLACRSLLGPKAARAVAAETKVSHVTIVTWRRQAKAAAREIGLEEISRNGEAYRDLFIKNGMDLAGILNVSREAVKGLEIVLRGKGLLRGSRVDNIVKVLKKRVTPIERKGLMRKYHLSRTEARRLMERMGWNNAER